MSKHTADEVSARSLRLSSLRSVSKRCANESSNSPYSSGRSLQSAPQQRSIQSDSSNEEAVDEEDDQEIEKEDDHAVEEEDDETANAEDYQAVDEEDDPLLYRVLTGVEYTRAQNAQRRPVMKTTRFVLNTRDQLHGRALSVLRQVGRDGLATRVAVDDECESWDIGVQRPNWVTEGALGGVHDPQWWRGLDATKIRAEPQADDADVTRARAVLRGVETQQRNKLENSAGEKSKKEQEMDWKLEEGLRQHLGLKMNDSDSSDTDLSLFISRGSDSSSSSSSSGSDDEPLILQLPNWRAEQQARSAATTGALREPSESLDSLEDHSDRPILDESDSSESEPFIIEWRKWKAVHRESKEDASPPQSEDDGPRIPVFSKWKAAQQEKRKEALRSESEDDGP